jgi:hypothetical protein
MKIGRLGKLDWKRWVSLFLFIITIGSSFAYSALQAFNQAPAQTGVQLPATDIIDYAMTPAQKAEALKQYITVLEYRHPIACTACASQQAVLEYYANTYTPQIILQEIADNSLTAPVLYVSSYIRSSNPPMYNIDQNTVMTSLCQLMYQPPVTCARLSSAVSTIATTAPTTALPSNSTNSTGSVNTPATTTTSPPVSTSTTVFGGSSNSSMPSP